MPICPQAIRDLAVDLGQVTEAESGHRHSLEERLKGLAPSGAMVRFINSVGNLQDSAHRQAAVPD